MKKTETHWAILGVGGMFLPFSVRSTRRQAISDFLKQWFNTQTWAALRRKGIRVIKVKCTWDKP